MSSFEKSVKGATKLAPPKSKYIEHILQGTRAGEPGVAEVFRALQYRLRDTTWTIAFKSLIVVHLMIREGGPNATLGYLSKDPRQILGGPSHTYADVQTQGRNIRHYTSYLIQRAASFQKARIDYVRSGIGRMKNLSIDKGLLRETESVQEQIQALVRCDILTDEPENEITLTAFRLLAMDLLALFPVLNEATINVLENFFEMSRPDAERALGIYKRFAKQTDEVVRFLQVAKTHESATRLEIPKVKHAPLSLATSLEEYLNDTDFETNRRQYLAEREAKQGGGPAPKPSEAQAPRSTPSQTTTAPSAPRAQAQTTVAPSLGKHASPDLIDFFSSIEQYSQPTTQQPAFQQAAFQQQQQQPQTVSFNDFPGTSAHAPTQNNNPYGQIQQAPQLQTQFTGAGFGGYGPQSYAQQPYTQQPSMVSTTGFPSSDGFGQQASGFQQPQQLQSQPTSNPFRQSLPQTINPQFDAGFSAPQQQQQQQTTSNPYQQALATGMPFQQTQQQQADMFGQQADMFGQQQPLYGQQQPQQVQATSMPFQQHQQGQQQQTDILAQQQSPYGQQEAQQPQPQSIISPPTGTNPFARNAPQPSNATPMSPQKTGTNPFARGTPITTQAQPPLPNNFTGQQAAPLVASPTGSTNPFRQSAFVNQNTGLGWQHGQGTMGGLEQLGTVSVFPRPGAAQGGQAPQRGQSWYQ